MVTDAKPHYYDRMWGRGENRPKCSSEDCTSLVRCKGLCARHYKQSRYAPANTGTCSVDGCDDPVFARQLCGKHYTTQRKLKYGPCAVEGCTGLKNGRTHLYCGNHQKNVRKYGGPLAPPRRRKEKRIRPVGRPKTTLEWKRRRAMWRDARRRAQQNNLPFNIDTDDIVIPTHCRILGIPLVHGLGAQGDHSPTIDRIRPDAGYVKGNVCVISSRANRLKSNFTPEEVVKLAKYVHKWVRN